jgi:hypothetical protein
MNLCNANHSGVTYYIPHHGVLKEDSLTTKLRVVFDASAPTTSGYSFNDLQRVGPTLQNDIFLILLRFRKYTYGLSSDVQMMYRMIWVDPSQHLLQRILWRADPSKPIQIYELKTVTYGTTSAPYLAIRCMLEIANQIENEQPNIAEIIRNCFYVDDYLRGADDIESAQQICKTLTNALKTRGLILRKWVSNDPTTLKELDPNLLTSSMTNLGSDANTKTLGILWSQQEDVIKCKVSKAPSTTRWTKRSILSCIAQIYDPFGLLSPCIIQAKIMLQKIWLENLTWDESLPSNIFTEWRKFHSELKYLQELSTPRHVLINNPTRLELHGFSDACLTSYGACIYIRSVKDEQVVVRLLCAKSKVSPLKKMTIPRLELQAALMLAKLVTNVRTALTIKIDTTILWCDSTIALCWIKSEPRILKTFVSNRVSQIQDLTENDLWRYISTKQNPADLVSRGISPRQLENLSVWWNGPSFLSELHYEFPPQPQIQEDPVDFKKEVRTVTLMSTSQIENRIPIERFSSLIKLKRVTAYCLRFVNNMRRSKEQRQNGPLTLNEITTATNELIKIAQRGSFSEEMNQLEQNKPLRTKSKLLSLNAGAFIIKDRKGRGSKTSKCYLCLFICFVTKAVHLELVSDMTTEAFILALRRFASRRGIPQEINSDNGTNFQGAKSELEELGKFLRKNEDELVQAYAQEQCNWKFIPAYSPHMGGLWEAGVKATKYDFKRVMSSTILKFEQLYSLIVQIEGILNARPLSPLSQNPNDLTPLTPSHFLIG